MCSEDRDLNINPLKLKLAHTYILLLKRNCILVAFNQQLYNHGQHTACCAATVLCFFLCFGGPTDTGIYVFRIAYLVDSTAVFAMANILLIALLLFSVFSCVLVDPQTPGFMFSFETENGVKRAYAYGTPDFHGTYFYYTNDGVRHTVNFGGSERASGLFVALAASRPVGPPAKYPTTSTPAPARPQTQPPAAYYGAYPSVVAEGGSGGGYGGGGGGGSQSIAPGLVASAVGGGLG